MKSYLYILALLSSNFLFAQAKTMRVKAGDDIAQAYSSHGFYRFPQFGSATLYYKSGGQSFGQQFNYNILSGSLQFIGPKGDTLDLAGPSDIDSIVFEGNVFLYNEGFLEKAASADSIVLLKKIVIRTQTENVGAYGMPNSTASIVNFKNFTTGTGVYNLVMNQDVVVTESVYWYFSVGNSEVLKSSKANLLKLLPAKKQSTAEMYLKQNKTNFEKEGDLKKLMAAIAN